MAFDLRRIDTICAVSTPRGTGALAVVRWSGPAAVSIRDQIFRRRRPAPIPHRLAVRGDVIGDDDAVLDDAICVTFPGPHSVTGEDVVELSIHGGALIADLVLARLVTLGARVAEPGEFTLRSVLTGRLDLTAAEAVEAVVGARTTAALAAAQRGLRGGLRDTLTPLRTALVDALAELEARLDFPDEPLGDANRQALVDSLRGTGASLQHLVALARRGRRLHDGARVVLWGAPNAGKSTLLNALVGHERALVHHEPGTTRDAVEAHIDVGGVPVVVVDVAGIRDDDGIHAVEAHGIAKARLEVARADIIVVLNAVGAPPAPALPTDIEQTAQILRVRSKCDLLPDGADDDDGDGDDSGAVSVSVHRGEGLEALLARLASMLGDGGETPLVHTARQEAGLLAAADACAAGADAVDAALPDELACSELRRAARGLDAVLGTDVDEDVLDLIFSRFCIGK